MSKLDRRHFGKQALGSLLTYALLETAWHRDAFGKAVRPIAADWVADLERLGRDVKGQTLSQPQWQTQVEALLAKIELPELLKFLDFDRLAGDNALVDRGARSIRFRFPEVEGLPKKFVFGKQIFGLKRGRSVIPHGHNNMATAFLILQGDLHGRHYDRLQDADDHLLLRPTIDRKFAPGEYSTVSDYKDNVHWFEAVSERAYIFNIHVLDVAPGSRLPTGRVYVNPRGEKLAGGLIKAPRIGYKQAQELFG